MNTNQPVAPEGRLLDWRSAYGFLRDAGQYSLAKALSLDVIALETEVADLKERNNFLVAAGQHWLTVGRENDELRAEVATLREQWIKTSHEITQVLGKALRYPWLKDDQKNFPGTTEADGVCVGEHVPESLASEAADCIAALRKQLEESQRLHEIEYRRNLVLQRDNSALRVKAELAAEIRQRPAP